MSKLFELVDRKLLNLFVVDLCEPTTEPIYHLDKVQEHLVLDKNSIVDERKASFGRVVCPQLDTLTNKDVWLLLEEACKRVPDERDFIDAVPSIMLHNPQDFASNIEKLSGVGKRFGLEYYPTYRDSIECAWWIGSDFVPQGQVFFLPNPQFLGCIFDNGSKFAAFALTQYILKAKL